MRYLPEGRFWAKSASLDLQLKISAVLLWKPRRGRCRWERARPSLRKQHAGAFKAVAEEAGKNNHKPVRLFVLYALRHTFLTRLGESGCDAWTLARIAGHSSISISSRYVHPSEDAVLAAMSRLGGHNSGHTQQALPEAQTGLLVTQ
jgi:integrase